MDRLIPQQIDFNHKPLWHEQRVAGRKARPAKPPRAADSYRGARRNARTHVERSNPSTGKGYAGPVGLNRSRKWRYAETYQDARDLSQSNREVV